MSYRGLTVLVVVPARGGSKGIPRKNLARLGGLSLVGHAARTALALSFADRCVLSTDDDAIAAEGRAHGLDVPFRRPTELATDTAAGVDAWRHAWLAAEVHYGMGFDLSVYLQPTTPLREPHEVEATVRAVVEGGHKAAATISRVPGHFAPHKILTMDADGRLGFSLPEGAKVVARQQAPVTWYRNGLAYAARRAAVVDDRHIVEDDCVGVVIDRPLANIDEPIDLVIAEALLQQGG
ncbi:MAG: acylneuraminate cytidylyltransferase family protein [Alphaproteobacteria bacterium]|nr:acylneuraminate cytidylyltransferase family protein [Alphaproteobacteria bacterium]